MMKRLLTCCMLLMLLLTLTAAPAAAGSFIVAGKSVQELFREFVTDYFNEALYNEACQFLNTHPEILELADAQDYKLYLDGVVCMNESNYADAALYFDTLRSKAEPFHNSETLYQYCSGRIAESEQDYEQAILCYRASYAYGDAQERMLSCHKLVKADDDVYTDIYLNALNYMDLGEFKYAATLFQILRAQAPQFYYCEQMYNYCSGRDAENSGDYAAAIVFYQNAATYEHSWKRIAGCLEKMAAAETQKENARILEADELYQRGVSRQDVETLKQARSRYDELGEKAKAEQCTEQIALIENQQDYSSALAQYNTAAAAGNVSGLKLAASAFSALGTYSDSAAMVETINALIERLERKLSVTSTTADSSSITLAWSDSSAEACAYTVSWAPQHAPAATSFTTEARTCTLFGLLPGTAYEITVSPEGMPELAQKLTFSTTHASVYNENGFMLSSTSVYSVSRTSLKRLSLQAALESDSVKVHDGNRITLEPVNMAFQPRVYVYYISYSLTEMPAGPINYQLVLRTKSSGTYAGAVQEAQTLRYPVGRFYIELEPLLESLYTACGTWPEETCTVEMYINGQLAAKGTLALEP